MKTFYCNDENIDRSCFLTLKAMSELYNIEVYSVSTQDIFGVIDNFKPEFVVLSYEQYKSINKKLEEMNKNFHTKIIVTGQNISKNKKFKTVLLNTNSFDLFSEFYVPKKNNESMEYLVCDLDSVNMENNRLLSPYIYPQNSKNPIRLVGCDRIQHPQNLGNIAEDDMLDLIYGSSGYINISNKYIHDAVNMKKPILNLVDNGWKKTNTFEILDTLPVKKLSEIIKSCVKI